MEKAFEVIDHTADIGIVAYGADIKQVFTNAALGLFQLFRSSIYFACLTAPGRIPALSIYNLSNSFGQDRLMSKSYFYDRDASFGYIMTNATRTTVRRSHPTTHLMPLSGYVTRGNTLFLFQITRR